MMDKSYYNLVVSIYSSGLYENASRTFCFAPFFPRIIEINKARLFMQPMKIFDEYRFKITGSKTQKVIISWKNR